MADTLFKSVYRDADEGLGGITLMRNLKSGELRVALCTPEGIYYSPAMTKLDLMMLAARITEFADKYGVPDNG